MLVLCAPRLCEGGTSMFRFVSDKDWNVEIIGESEVTLQEYSKTYSFMADRTECEGQQEAQR